MSEEDGVTTYGKTRKVNYKPISGGGHDNGPLSGLYSSSSSSSLYSSSSGSSSGGGVGVGVHKNSSTALTIHKQSEIIGEMAIEVSKSVSEFSKVENDYRINAKNMADEYKILEKKMAADTQNPWFQAKYEIQRNQNEKKLIDMSKFLYTESAAYKDKALALKEQAEDDKLELEKLQEDKVQDSTTRRNITRLQRLINNLEDTSEAFISIAEHLPTIGMKRKERDMPSSMAPTTSTSSTLFAGSVPKTTTSNNVLHEENRDPDGDGDDAEEDKEDKPLQKKNKTEKNKKSNGDDDKPEEKKKKEKKGKKLPTPTTEFKCSFNPFYETTKKNSDSKTQSDQQQDKETLRMTWTGTGDGSVRIMFCWLDLKGFIRICNKNGENIDLKEWNQTFRSSTSSTAEPLRVIMPYYGSFEKGVIFFIFTLPDETLGLAWKEINVANIYHASEKKISIPTHNVSFTYKQTSLPNQDDSKLVWRLTKSADSRDGYTDFMKYFDLSEMKKKPKKIEEKYPFFIKKKNEIVNYFFANPPVSSSVSSSSLLSSATIHTSLPSQLTTKDKEQQEQEAMELLVSNSRALRSNHTINSASSSSSSSSSS